jgi:tetratricopeptide (TPR) repeat protein/transcriptional regulator with XRE-family HTH domain
MTAGAARRSVAGPAEGGAGVGELVRAWRERALLTQEQLAERTGLSLRTVRRLESGEGGRPRSSSLGLLAAALKLSEAEREILVSTAWGRRAPSAAGSSADRPAAGGLRPAEDVPRQLPAPPQGFTGRAAELAELGRAADAATVVISAIDGMAGTGKTALAVHAAHQLVGAYPDGQLFLDLHGCTEGVPPVDPGEALNQALRALGIPDPQIPAHVDERAALFRSRLAGRQIMVVLDNAADEAQVAPLLPGTPGCLVLITSRRHLAGLDHTHAVSLDVLPPRDATTLFADAAGRQRLAGEPSEVVAEAAELCGRLPLAIRIAAARLRSRPAWTTSHLMARLRDDRRRLAELAAGPRSVTAALDLSYRDLGARLRRAYRMLGLHPGADFDIYAAAALLDATLDGAEQAAQQLLDMHLLQEPTPGRFRFHDLIRQHAMARAAHEEAEADRRAALTRLLDHYRHVASVAMGVGNPCERARRRDIPPAETPAPALGDETEAIRWLDRELPNLLAVAAHGADHGWPDHVMHLSATLNRYLCTRGRYTDAESLLDRASAAARATGYRAGEVEALCGLGAVHRLLGRYELAAAELIRAIAIARVTGDRTMELEALVGLGYVRLMQAQYEAVADNLGKAHRIARDIGDRNGEMLVLNGLGQLYWHQRRHEEAIGVLEQALDLARVTGNWSSGQLTLATLGHIHRQRRLDKRAIGYFEQSLEVSRDIGDRNGELAALVGLGWGSRIRGEYARAAHYYRTMLELAEEIGSRNYQFEAHQGMGRVQVATGRPEESLVSHGQALDLAASLGQRIDEARAHDGLASANHALHNLNDARRHWQRALEILDALGVDQTIDNDVTVSAIRTHLGTPAPQH